jgi:uncharacterized protein (DUF1330 family)
VATRRSTAGTGDVGEGSSTGRKVIVSEFVSLDGVMEAPDRWHFPFWHDETGTYKRDELFASDALPKCVVSTTLDEVAWNNSRPIKGNVAEEAAKLKREPGQDILVGGSADLVNGLMRHDLVDDYRLMVHPVVVGHGKRLCAKGGETKAPKPVETTPLGPDVVVPTYSPAGR